MKRKERKYNPKENIIPAAAKSDRKPNGFFRFWRKTRKDHFEGDKYVGGFDPDSVSKGNFKPGEKPSDFAGL